MRSRRPRKLTEGEARLWQSIARTTRRLRPDAGDEAPLPPVPAPPSPAKSPATKRLPVSAPASPRPSTHPLTTVDLAPDPLAEAAYAPPRIDKRRFERMMRGKLSPEARLDLHGMTRDAAHAVLVSFILSSQAQGLRLVLVITGKGRPPDRSDSVIPERQGILRHSLPHWLNTPPLRGRILEVRSAHARHGGGGAVYLYLRRRG